MAPGFGCEAAFQRLFRLAGGDIDHAADGVAAPQDRLRPAQDLDPLGIVEEEVGKAETARSGGGIGQAHAVQHHHRLAAVRPPDAQRGNSAVSAVARQADARRAQQDIAQRDRLVLDDGGLVENGNAGGYALLRNRRA